MINQYFDVLRDAIDRTGILMRDVWNMDEKGFTLGVGRGKNIRLIVPVNVKQLMRRQPRSREWVTLNECVSVEGSHIPAFYIDPGKGDRQAPFEDVDTLDPETRFAKTHNGWTDDKVALEWLHHFQRHARPSEPGLPRLLLLDNHSSHDTFEFKEFAVNNNIHLLCFASHATHVFQDLDYGVFNPLGCAYEKRVRTFFNTHNFGDQIQKRQAFSMIEDARKKVLRPPLIKAAFEACGISLTGLNRTRVLSRPDIRDDAVQPYAGPPTRSHPTLAQGLHHPVQGLPIQDGASPALRKALDSMGDKLEETEAALQINTADLKAALEREKPTRGSQKVVSKARTVTAGELANSRHIHSTGRRTRNDTDPPEPPRKRGARGRGRGARGGRSRGSRADAPNAEPSSDAEDGTDDPAPPEHSRRARAASWGGFGHGRRGRGGRGGRGRSRGRSRGRGEGGDEGELGIRAWDFRICWFCM